MLKSHHKKDIRQMLRNQDIFGHHFKLNFNRRGDVHPTPVGGCMSIVLKILYLAYFAYLVNKMITYDDDRNYEFTYQIGAKNLEERINTKQLGLTQF